MKCQNCDYEWESRVEKPKACPRCKYRLDYPKNEFVRSIAKTMLK